MEAAEAAAGEAVAAAAGEVVAAATAAAAEEKIPKRNLE